MSWLYSLQNWVNANPVLFSLVVWPLVLACVNWFAKPRTDEQLAAMSPRAAAFWRLLRKIGPDTKGALDALYQLFTGKPRPPSSGDGSTTLRVISGGLSALALGVSIGACAASIGPGDRQTVEDYAAKLLHCQEAGRAAPDGGHLAAYEECKREAGVQ